MKKLLSPLLVSIILFAACSLRNPYSPTLSAQGGILPTLASTLSLRPISTAAAHATNTPETPAPLPSHTKTSTQTLEPSYCTQLRDRYHPPEGFLNYCDAKYGFAVDYPNTWTIATYEAGSPEISRYISRSVTFMEEGMTNYIRVDTYYMPSGSNLERQVQQYETYPYREITDKLYDIRIGGQPAITILNVFHQDYSEVNVFFQHGQYYSVVAVKTISQSGLETNWQIVSSIQVVGVEGHDNQIPEDLIDDSYRLIDPRSVPQP